MGRKLGEGDCSPFWRELDPHLTQCGQGRGLSARQVSSWSIQPFGHNTPTLQTEQMGQRSDSIGQTFYKRSPKNHYNKILIIIELCSWLQHFRKQTASVLSMQSAFWWLVGYFGFNVATRSYDERRGDYVTPNVTLPFPWCSADVMLIQKQKKTSGYATMVHGRGCNPHRCTTTFAKPEITSLLMTS